MRVWARPDGTFDLPKVSVFGRKNLVTTVDIPAYRVKNCDSLRHVAIFTRLLPNSSDEYELEAKIEDTGSGSQSDHQPFRATRYEWTFGDGKSAQTDNPRIEHQFTGPQKSWYSSYLVAVEAVDAAGERVRGRHSLQVMNTTFENFDQRGIVTIVATPTPRFPVLDDDGVVRQRFRLRHHAKGTIRISRVMATYQHSAPKVGPRVDDWTVPTGELALQAVPEGDGTEVSVSLNTLKDADLFSITYLLEGTSEDGYPARGTFSVMRPPPKPTKENSEPITDAVLLAKVRLARKLLGQPFVTDEDFFRLEREGKFADLKVEQAPKSSAPPSEPSKSEATYRQQ